MDIRIVKVSPFPGKPDHVFVDVYVNNFVHIKGCTFMAKPFKGFSFFLPSRPKVKGKEFFEKGNSLTRDDYYMTVCFVKPEEHKEFLKKAREAMKQYYKENPNEPRPIKQRTGNKGAQTPNQTNNVFRGQNILVAGNSANTNVGDNAKKLPNWVKPGAGFIEIPKGYGKQVARRTRNPDGSIR